MRVHHIPPFSQWPVVHSKATELFVAHTGLFWQVITVLCSTRGHIPMENSFKVLGLRLNAKSKTLHTQWMASGNGPDLEGYAKLAQLSMQ